MRYEKALRWRLPGDISRASFAATIERERRRHYRAETPQQRLEAYRQIAEGQRASCEPDYVPVWVDRYAERLGLLGYSPAHSSIECWTEADEFVRSQALQAAEHRLAELQAPAARVIVNV